MSYAALGQAEKGMADNLASMAQCLRDNGTWTGTICIANPEHQKVDPTIVACRESGGTWTGSGCDRPSGSGGQPRSGHTITPSRRALLNPWIVASVLAGAALVGGGLFFSKKKKR